MAIFLWLHTQNFHNLQPKDNVYCPGEIFPVYWYFPSSKLLIYFTDYTIVDNILRKLTNIFAGLILVPNILIYANFLLITNIPIISFLCQYPYPLFLPTSLCISVFLNTYIPYFPLSSIYSFQYYYVLSFFLFYFPFLLILSSLVIPPAVFLLLLVFLLNFKSKLGSNTQIYADFISLLRKHIFKGESVESYTLFFI